MRHTMKLLTLVAGLAATVLTGCGGPADGGERQARVGEILEGDRSMQGRAASIRLPYRQYDFLVSAPEPTYDGLLRERQEDGGETLDSTAPDGTSFVKVRYRYGGPTDDARLIAGYDPTWGEYLPGPELTLVADGKDYPIGAIGGQGDAGPWTVVVRGSPHEVHVRLGFEGREVEVDPADAVKTRADVYSGRTPRLDTAPCPPQGVTEVVGGAEFRGTQCRVDYGGPVPYVAGLGWAPTGQAWVVVKSRIKIATFFAQGTGADYIARDTEYGEPTYTLDGEPPVRMEDSQGNEIQSRPRDMGVNDVRRLIFSVADDTRRSDLAMSLTYRGVPKSGASRSEKPVRFDFRRTVDLVYR